MHKKRILLHVLFLVLFLIGIGAAAYPAFGNWYNEQKRSVVLTEYEKALAKIEDADLTDAFKQAEIYNDALFTGETDEEERPDYGELLCTTEDGIMGYVEIPAIQIRLPIYHGCTENELSKGAGHLPSSSLPVGGKSTHAVLAAHSGRADSKMFTDLDQVKEGDLVYLYVLNKTLTYEVDKITVTTPDDTDAIQIIDGEDLLTLLTCTPYGTNTHRLLVRGHRIFPDETLSTSKPSEAKPEHPDTAVHRSTWTNEYRNGLTEGLLFALLILLISVFLYGIIRLKAKRS
ncbi:class C sortase [Hominenteromicrobium sp.]|uniref:class C sortase n=1 Tax=Hominenteromicrobium sp. TaxID=3073581 RepID=UPI003995BAB2